MVAEHEPTRRHALTFDERVGHTLEAVERVLIYVVALFLIGFAVLALIDTVSLVVDPIFKAHDYTLAITEGIDKAFLTVILLELLHTVLSRGPISRQLQEFLVIGITSVVRNSLEIAVSRGHRSSRDVVIDLAINAAGVLILVAALWLVRQQMGVAPEERLDSAPRAVGDAAR